MKGNRLKCSGYIIQTNNVDNLNNERREARRYFRNKKKEYPKPKMNEYEANSKNKNIRDLYRDITEFKYGNQPRTNVVEDEKGDLVADSHCILLGRGIISFSY
jgi:hypothetical protein